MSKEYEFEIDAHPSIYSHEKSPRKLKIYFNEPEHEINKDTGILLMIPGFGGNASSNVYKKMRGKFSDEHNLVTVQCDYFGWEFMQKPDNVNFQLNQDYIKRIVTADEYKCIYDNDKINVREFLKIISNYDVHLDLKEDLNEHIFNFNDMGIMQAIDNITAVLVIKAIINDNKFNINEGKIMIYGDSHGAYLAYLCNAFAPELFSLIIDNSAWLFPQYLINNREILQCYNKFSISIQFEYLAKIYKKYDREILDLTSIYNKFENKCKIISYHGVNDGLITCNEKKKFCLGIDGCIFNEINENKIDGEIFKSTSHGLDLDFIKFFNLIMKNEIIFNNKEIKLSNIKYSTNANIYEFDYKQGIPILNLYKKFNSKN
ncbi:DUF2920 family protein [Clostridium lundense]|uniref:DUF2920 family protein n=1 Tax=Clostridium lundense TaxID=319475 RepID=UPI00048204A4|nr:DUF2920 family protein [Clostridium lundense]